MDPTTTPTLIAAIATLGPAEISKAMAELAAVAMRARAEAFADAAGIVAAHPDAPDAVYHLKLHECASRAVVGHGTTC